MELSTLLTSLEPDETVEFDTEQGHLRIRVRKTVGAQVLQVVRGVTFDAIEASTGDMVTGNLGIALKAIRQ